MLNQDIINYIKYEQAQGTSRDAITTALMGAGWQRTDIDQAFDGSLISTGTSTAPVVTEKDYPITKLWIFKAPINVFLVSVIVLFLGRFLYISIAIPIYLIANPLIRRNFHYSVEDKFFVVKQGVFSKKQRNLPYGVIQNVLVKQDIFDRIFGLASLRVENAAQGGNAGAAKSRSFRLTLTSTRSREDSVGSSGNRVNIPGLKKKDAEALKNIVLQKMKDNPLEDNQSGL